jgi:hypothetical protein
MTEGDPFAALGLAARADVSDDDVRAAWRRIAAAAHPDRDDGGDPVRFAAAAAAYARLRTSFGRGEALADMAEAAAVPRWRRLGRPLPGRRPLPLAARVLAAAAVVALAFLTAGWSPGTAGVLTGAVTWLTAVLWRGRWSLSPCCSGSSDRRPRLGQP